MNKLYLCTSNKWKVELFSNYAKNYDFVVESINFDIPESRNLDCWIISEEKVIYSYNKIKKPVIAVDSWLYIDALWWFPMTFVKFALGSIWVEWIIKLLEWKPRTCVIVNSVSFFDTELSVPITFKEELKWHISSNIAWNLKPYNWSVLHKIFIPDWSKKTLAEMSKDEYLLWNNKRLEGWFVEQMFDFIFNK